MGTSLKWQASDRKRDKKASSRKEHAPDYRSCAMELGERMRYMARGTLLALLLSWFFYRSLWASLFLALLIIPAYLKETGRKLAKERRQELILQFRDTILAVSAGLQAGYSMENAFFEARGDMERLYGTESLMARELDRIQRGIRNNIPLETLLMDLGLRSGETDIEDFAEVFSIAKRTGGNMDEIIRRSVEITRNKIEVKQEIHTLLSSRRYEQRIMNRIPFLIMAYLQLTSPGFFDVLYHNAVGVAVMSGALAVYLAAYWLSGKIVEIEV